MSLTARPPGAMRRCEKATGLPSMTAATLASRSVSGCRPIVLEPLLEGDVVHRNLTGDVQHRLGVELVHLAWVERGEWEQIDAGRGAPGLDRSRVDAGDPNRVGVPETVCGGEPLRRPLLSGEREH